MPVLTFSFKFKPAKGQRLKAGVKSFRADFKTQILCEGHYNQTILKFKAAGTISLVKRKYKDEKKNPAMDRKHRNR